MFVATAIRRSSKTIYGKYANNGDRFAKGMSTWVGVKPFYVYLTCFTLSLGGSLATQEAHH
jgi:hypothetical protein